MDRATETVANPNIPALSGASPHAVSRDQSLTRYECWQLFISVLGFFGVISTLLFNTLQIREMSKQSRFTTYSQATSNILEIDRIFLQYPNLRPYFYEGKKVTVDDPVCQQVVATAELMLDIFDLTISSMGEQGTLPPGESQWTAWIRSSFAKSPALCDHLESHQDWYSLKIYHIMKSSKNPKGRL